MMHEIDIDLSDLIPAGFRFDASKPGAQTVAAIEFDGIGLRVPLAVFFCEPVRREIERQLQTRGVHPQWELAQKSVDAAGSPIRLVAVNPIDRTWS
jgi:hypothetical protein